MRRSATELCPVTWDAWGHSILFHPERRKDASQHCDISDTLCMSWKVVKQMWRSTTELCPVIWDAGGHSILFHPERRKDASQHCDISNTLCMSLWLQIYWPDWHQCLPLRLSVRNTTISCTRDRCPGGVLRKIRFTAQSSNWQSDSRSGVQGIPWFYATRKLISIYFHKSQQPLDPIVSYMNPVHNLTPYYLNTILILSLCLRLPPPSGLPFVFSE
jgi:aromatic ring-cleaving dioxygenase